MATDWELFYTVKRLLVLCEDKNTEKELKEAIIIFVDLLIKYLNK